MFYVSEFFKIISEYLLMCRGNNIVEKMSGIKWYKIIIHESNVRNFIYS